MARKKKNGNHKKTVESLIVAAAILNLITEIIELIEKLID